MNTTAPVENQSPASGNGLLLTTREAAGRLAVAVDTVLDLIRRRELGAICVSVKRRSQKPRYRIESAELDRFIERRRLTAAPPPAPRPRRALGYERIV